MWHQCIGLAAYVSWAIHYITEREAGQDTYVGWIGFAGTLYVPMCHVWLVHYVHGGMTESCPNVIDASSWQKMNGKFQ